MPTFVAKYQNVILPNYFYIKGGAFMAKEKLAYNPQEIEPQIQKY